jgi:hypothetical protein
MEAIAVGELDNVCRKYITLTVDIRIDIRSHLCAPLMITQLPSATMGD